MWAAVPSPIGDIGVGIDLVAERGADMGADTGTAGGGAIVGTSFEGRGGAVADDGPTLLVRARRQLDEYFAGERTEFDVPYEIRRGSEFERAVWAQIAAIPYGETLSYGAIAKAVGEPKAAQAVGLACHRNPVPIIVPCHRVIGVNGKLVGFGGGLHRKRHLLQLEAKVYIERTFAF